MNIWQFILVMFPLINFGFSTAGALDKETTTRKKWAAVIANLLICFVSEFIMYKAGVLIIK